MTTAPSKLPYTLAILYGLLAFFIPDEPLPVLFALFYLLGGGLFGFLWPKKSWRWGLWIAGPLVAILGLSVLFAGELNTFFKNDLPLLLLAVASACLGSYFSVWFKRRLTASRNS